MAAGDRFFSGVEPFEIEERVYSFVVGVTVGPRPSRAGHAVYIMKIRKINRSEGNASRTLDHICTTADDNSVTQFLEVEESDGLAAP